RHHLVQAGAPGTSPADAMVRIPFDAFELPLPGQLFQVMELGLGVLVQGRDPHIEDRPVVAGGGGRNRVHAYEDNISVICHNPKNTHITFSERTSDAASRYKVWYKDGVLYVWLDGNLVYSNDGANATDTGDLTLSAV